MNGEVELTRLDQRPPPDRLYHYTSSAGLLGILANRSIWATDVAYLNDSSELEFGLRDLLKRIETITRSDRSRGHRSFLDRLAARYDYSAWEKVADRNSEAIEPKRYSELAQELMQRVQVDVTVGVACFCEDDGDSLSQWRGYGSAGYSIGFSARRLLHHTRTMHLPLTAVVYGAPSGRAYWTSEGPFRIIDSVFAEPGAALESVPSQTPTSLALDLVRLASQVKNVSFRQELEWRIGDIATSDDARLAFRSSAIGLVPYIVLPLVSESERLLPIEHICVAPGLEPALRVAATETLLRSHGYAVGKHGVKVTSSVIPFRG